MTEPAARRRIFRASALDALSSPEQLDELIPITRPRAWLAMAALWMAACALIVWAVIGVVSTRVSAQGVILSEPVVDITPAWSGQVLTMRVAVGDTIRRDQLVATLDQPELVDAVRHQQARLNEVATELRQRTAAADSTVAIQRHFYTQQRASLEESIRDQEQVVRALQTRAMDERTMVDRGLESRDAYLLTQQQLNVARDALGKTRGELTQLGASQFNAEALARATLIQSENTNHEAQRELQRLRDDLARRSQLRSAIDGVLLERLVDPGDLLTPGQPAARVQRVGADAQGLRALLYVSGEDGKRVRAGMELRVAPANVRPEEHGYLRARVRRITALPASSQAIRQALRNDALVASVAALNQPFQIEADFVPDANTPSGYKWSSMPGPSLRIESGTPARAQVIVERRRPLALVLPMLRRAFSLE